MLTDDLNIRDGLGVSGLVVITDLKTGKVILKKHNMITKYGKKVIYYHFLSNLIEDNYISGYNQSAYSREREDLAGYKLCKIALGTSEAETYYTMPNLVAKIDSSVDVFNNNMISITDNDDSAPYIKLSCNFSNKADEDTNVTAVSELGLFLSKNKEKVISSDDKLFSRITFDPIPYLEDTSFRLDYYIYF